jgi:secondary thiamine-phosphate synthase enzyme
MRQYLETIIIPTSGRGLVDITERVLEHVAASGITCGIVNLFVRHTSASLLIQENADPTVRHDLERYFARLVPDGDALFRHQDEGPDDMPAHVRTALTAVNLAVPVQSGMLALGTWQGIYLWEHRRQGHRREVMLHVLGEP